MNELHTVEDVAAHFGLTPEQVVRKCSAPLNPWPHLRPIARKSSTWRFSDQDVADIEARISARMVGADAWGRTGKKSA